MKKGFFGDKESKPPELAPTTEAIPGKPKILILDLLFIGVDAENNTQQHEAKMIAYAAAAQEYLREYYGIYTGVDAILKYYREVQRTALTAAFVETGGHAQWDATIVGNWIGGQIQREVKKQFYRLVNTDTEKKRGRGDDLAAIQAKLLEAVFEEVTNFEPQVQGTLSLATRTKLAEAAKIAQRKGVKAALKVAVKATWDRLEASLPLLVKNSDPTTWIRPAEDRDPVLLARIVKPEFSSDQGQGIIEDPDAVLGSEDSAC